MKVIQERIGETDVLIQAMDDNDFEGLAFEDKVEKKISNLKKKI